MKLDRSTIIPDVCGGEPTIRGMRITASQVLEMLAGGMNPEEILRDFPYLEQRVEDLTRLECAMAYSPPRDGPGGTPGKLLLRT